MIGSSLPDIDRTSKLWRAAQRAIQEAQLVQDSLKSQIRDLAKDDGFLIRCRNVMLGQILEGAIGNTGASMGNIQLVDPKTKCLFICIERGFGDNFLVFFESVEPGQAACGLALRTTRQQVVPDTSSSELFADSPTLEVLLDANVRAVQSTPIMGSTGQVLGVISTHYRTPREVDPGELRAIDHFARQAAVLLEECFCRAPHGVSSHQKHLAPRPAANAQHHHPGGGGLHRKLNLKIRNA